MLSLFLFAAPSLEYLACPGGWCVPNRNAAYISQEPAERVYPPHAVFLIQPPVARNIYVYRRNARPFYYAVPSVNGRATNLTAIGYGTGHAKSSVKFSNQYPNSRMVVPVSKIVYGSGQGKARQIFANDEGELSSYGDGASAGTEVFRNYAVQTFGGKSRFFKPTTQK